jgi:hypothetical protein
MCPCQPASIFHMSVFGTLLYKRTDTNVDRNQLGCQHQNGRQQQRVEAMQQQARKHQRRSSLTTWRMQTTFLMLYFSTMPRREGTLSDARARCKQNVHAHDASNSPSDALATGQARMRATVQARMRATVQARMRATVQARFLATHKQQSIRRCG